MGRRPAITLLIALATTVAVSGIAHAALPVLGSRSYMPYGGGGEGFGASAPSTIFNGGDPGGRVDGIRWTHWGASVAFGVGRAPIERPGGNYFTPVRAVLRATGLGACPGTSMRAYTQLWLREPQWPGGPLGPWLKWGGSRTMCDYADTDPHYDYPTRPPGFCKDIGRGFTARWITWIEAYGIGCARARGVLRDVQRVIRTTALVGCKTTTGCALRVLGMTCRLSVHPEDVNADGGGPGPVQRVACTRGTATVTAYRSLG